MKNQAQSLSWALFFAFGTLASASDTRICGSSPDCGEGEVCAERGDFSVCVPAAKPGGTSGNFQDPTKKFQDPPDRVPASKNDKSSASRFKLPKASPKGGRKKGRK